ncbi:MAG TPA: ATP-binding protein [Acidimicrobiales bacterium]
MVYGILSASGVDSKYGYGNDVYSGSRGDPVERPEDLYDRSQEWAELASFASSQKAGLRVAVVSGRRRQGKSFLLRRISEGVGGLYHQAQEVGRTQALARFGSDVGRRLGLPADALRFEDWESALRTALGLPERGSTVGPTAGPSGPANFLVLDELPYLLEHSPELPSVLQELYDETRHQRRQPPSAIVLCGSALSVMSELLSGQKPLRGRAQVDLTIRPFDYLDSAQFWGVGDPAVAFQLDAIFGGTPGYRSLIETPPPRSVKQLPTWLARSVLNPSHALFTETDYLLREDPRLPAKEAFHSILAAVAAGHRTQKAIGGAVGRDHNQLRHPLEVLIQSGFLIEHDDMLRARRPWYTLADPIVRFEELITTPCRALLEERDVHTAWSESAETFSANILGPHFEHICRRWTAQHSAGRFGEDVGEVGSAVINDGGGRSQHELDVVALRRGRRKNARPKLAVLGEAKSSNRARNMGDLERLERIKELLGGRADVSTTSLALFGRSGFNRTLAAAAEARPDVHLVDLKELYRRPPLQ